MGKLRNGDDNVTINEVTVSHLATKNSPHDAVTWDPQGIRGVSMDGIHVYSNDRQVVRSVNVSVGGVSFECDAAMLDVLGDKEARESLVTRSLEAQAEKDRIAATPHEWAEDEGRASAVDGKQLHAFQCKRCTSWVVGTDGMEKPTGGCLGRAPTEEEKRHQNAQAAIQELGRRLQALHEMARTALQNGADPEAVLKACAGLGAMEKEVVDVMEFGFRPTMGQLGARDGALSAGATQEEAVAYAKTVTPKVAAADAELAEKQMAAVMEEGAHAENRLLGFEPPKGN